MKLKEFNTETCVRSTRLNNNGVPAVSIYVKSGTFRFNPEAQQLIGISEGDQVQFLQDEDDGDVWYIEKVKEKGFVVHTKEKFGKGVLFHNTILARQIADSVSFTGTSGKCLIAGEPTDFKKCQLFGLITGTLINK